MSREARRERLRELMERSGVGALLMSRPVNFAWYTGGADNRVDHSDPIGVASVLLTLDAEYILTDNIEAPRIEREQTPEIQIVQHPWYEDQGGRLRELSGGSPVAADFPYEPATDLSAEITPLRYVLDPEAIERYRRLGTSAVSAMSEAAGSITSGMNEIEAAAVLGAACRKRGNFTPVLFAASETRMKRYRHPIPADERLGGLAMLVVCAERGGLFANFTRIVYFEDPDDETSRRQRACDNVLRRMREEATRPGRTLAEAFDDCRRFYAEEGFPDGWKDHHQGGMTGYASREVVATPNTHQEIQTGQAFAWNPSLKGAKAEETFVLTGDGPESIT